MRSRRSLWRTIGTGCLLVLLPVILFFGARGLGEKTSAQSLSLASEGLRRAAVQFYALEGRYPITLAELTERYGAGVDTKRYFVDYEYIAENLMPSITVLPLGGEEDV